ncbi:MAG TPA: 50S ribosomal protein L15 [Treponemataceae bacterium]|nr:50S ribosomal protein L15 [Treponemataceae bacterium]
MEERYTLKKPESIKNRKRVGRGMSSGHGKTSCRGHKGQMSRSGAKRRAWFEGGQMPLQRRIPKRGFNNPFRLEFAVVNLTQIGSLGSQEIDRDILIKKGLVKGKESAIKILGNGSIEKAITVYADAFSATAKEKIEKAGGKAIVGRPAEQQKES